MRGLAFVVGVTVLAWLVMCGPSWLLGGDGPEVTVPAALVCLIPNLLALGVTELVKTRSLTAQTGVLLASFLVRPLLSVGLGLSAYYLLPDLRGRALSLLVWGALFYIILLVAESAVVARRAAGSLTGR